MKAARLHQISRGSWSWSRSPSRPPTAPFDVIIKVGAAGSVPHRSAHSGRAVGREVPGRAALHPRSRERRLGARDRLGGDQRRRRRHRDRPPLHLLRVVPAVPQGRRHALPDRLVSRDRPRRGFRRAAQDERPLGGQARPEPAARRTSPRWPMRASPRSTRSRRRSRSSRPGTKAVVIGAGGLGHIGVQCLKALTAAEIIVDRPVREGVGARRRDGRRPRPSRSTATPTSTPFAR